MGELGREKIPLSTAKIVEEQKRDEGTEEKKPELSEEEKKMVDKIESVYDGYKEKLNKQYVGNVPDFIKKEILPKIPEIQHNSLQKVVNGLIERYSKDIVKKHNRRDFGDFLSLALINPTVDAYTEQELRKGKKLEEIKPLQTRISTEGMLIDNLVFRNPAKSNVTIEGPVGDYLGREMEGGGVDVFPSKIGKEIGKGMEGGELRIYGEVPDKNFSLSKSNDGKIWRIEDRKLKRYWPKGEEEKKEK